MMKDILKQTRNALNDRAMPIQRAAADVRTIRVNYKLTSNIIFRRLSFYTRQGTAIVLFRTLRPSFRPRSSLLNMQTQKLDVYLRVSLDIFLPQHRHLGSFHLRLIRLPSLTNRLNRRVKMMQKMNRVQSLLSRHRSQF